MTRNLPALTVFWFGNAISLRNNVMSSLQLHFQVRRLSRSLAVFWIFCLLPYTSISSTFCLLCSTVFSFSRTYRNSPWVKRLRLWFHLYQTPGRWVRIKVPVCFEASICFQICLFRSFSRFIRLHNFFFNSKTKDNNNFKRLIAFRKTNNKLS